jgi:hypothetical protein
MNRKITVIFLSTVLPAALIAGQNGLSPDILNRANSIKADAAALRGAISGPQGMLQATGSSATASLMNKNRAGLTADKFSGAESLMTNVPSDLRSSLSSGSTASETASLMNKNRAGLTADKFSGAESLMTNMPSDLRSSPASGSTASETASLMNKNRAGLKADKFSGAESLMTNMPSDLRSSPSSGLNLSKQELEQMHNSQLPASLVQ